jgi:hypothetical protein
MPWRALAAELVSAKAAVMYAATIPGALAARTDTATAGGKMHNYEPYIVWFAFLVVGIVVGYVTFLTFRISVHQEKFSWAGALSVITTLAGGGFLSYQSRAIDFAAYAYGFFVGFAAYLLLQFKGIPTGSKAASNNDIERPLGSSELGSQLLTPWIVITLIVVRILGMVLGPTWLERFRTAPCPL